MAVGETPAEFEERLSPGIVRGERIPVDAVGQHPIAERDQVGVAGGDGVPAPNVDDVAVEHRPFSVQVQSRLTSSRASAPIAVA